ncbi:sensor histidine kinase [Limnochorda pilosa]|uniref:histidine kinase n=1 Tax=Limnochorda pilosa TaxID=1555112 RepID=A0A0K2SFZ1_LIMPI|nr:HAMP domain-containing sensor histidine kinase [Limnochorda pilosa]BAS26023.1 hypothetical protein LIP_0166 [Limnochorda pilosa]
MRFARSLRFKFVAAFVFFVVSLSASLGWLASRQIADALYEQLLRRGELLLSDLRKEAASAQEIEEPLRRDLYLTLLTYRAVVGEVIYAQVVQDGQVLSQSSAASDGKVPSLPGAFAAVLAGGPGVTSPRVVVTSRGSDGSPYLDMLQVIPSSPAAAPAAPADGQEAAPAPSYVRLGLSLSQINGEIRHTQLRIGLLALAFVAAGLAVAFTLFQAILGPVGRMMGFVKRVGEGDLGARVEVTSGDELEALAHEFNQMADSLAHRDHALRQVNERLEEANRQLQQVNRELEQANQAKSRFLSTMGHELKTPLHSVRGYAQLLLRESDGRLTRSQREDTEAILQAGDHLLELIDNILFFNRTGEDREPLHLEPVELVELVGRAWDHVRFLAERRSVRLRLLAPRRVRVMADRTKLRQVMINLLHNAVKFTRHGVVQVRLEPGASVTVVEVSDTGKGLEPGNEEKVFDPFVQLGGQEEPGQEGIGLGLAVVRRFVQLHGGRVWAESGNRIAERDGRQGATFVVELPTSGPQLSDDLPEEAELHAHSGRG